MAKENQLRLYTHFKETKQMDTALEILRVYPEFEVKEKKEKKQKK